MRVEHIAEVPAGWKVRTVKRGDHRIRIAFPPGRRKKGSGKVVEILHPTKEKNPHCKISETAKKNPAELLIFGNPGGVANHKRDCKCPICARRNPAKGTKYNIYGKKYRASSEAEAKKRALRDRKLRGQRAAKQTFGKVNPKTKRSTAVKRRGRASSSRRYRRNSSETEEAVRLFESFHGKDPKGIVEKQVSAAMRLDYTALGDLEKLIVVTPIRQTVDFNFEGDGVKLAAAPPDKDGKSRQLYCIGGNQNISQCLDADSLQKDFIDVGECVQVEYLARKVHANFEPVSYYHKLGEKTGDHPRLMFDKLRKMLFFVGGAYYIDTSKGVSPGIEN